jgi:hypothetical protein
MLCALFFVLSGVQPVAAVTVQECTAKYKGSSDFRDARWTDLAISQGKLRCGCFTRRSGGDRNRIAALAPGVLPACQLAEIR